MTACRYDRLAVAVAYYDGLTLDDPPEPCTEPAAWYVRLVQADDDYVVEHLTNLCDGHDREARAFDGHQQSSRRRDRPAA